MAREQNNYKTYSVGDKLRCIERELKFRYRVYPKMVDEKKMTRRMMDREIEIMEEIAADFRAAVEKERLM